MIPVTPFIADFGGTTPVTDLPLMVGDIGLQVVAANPLLGGNDVDYEQMAAGILRSAPEPILNLEMMTRSDGSPLMTTESAEDVLARVLVAIQELQATSARKTELYEAAMLLREETEAEPPRPVLIRALIGLLQTQSELKSVVGRLEKRLASAELITVNRK